MVLSGLAFLYLEFLNFREMSPINMFQHKCRKYKDKFMRRGKNNVTYRDTQRRYSYEHIYCNTRTIVYH